MSSNSETSSSPPTIHSLGTDYIHEVLYRDGAKKIFHQRNVQPDRVQPSARLLLLQENAHKVLTYKLYGTIESQAPGNKP